MFSSNLSNVDKLMRMIVAFSNRITKRVENVGMESNESRSTSSSHSKNSSMFRAISNTL